MKRFLCVLSSIVIFLTCFCFSVSAEEPPMGYEIGECIFTDDDFSSYMKSKSSWVYLDSDGFYYLKDSYSSSDYLTFNFFTRDVVSPFYFVEYELCNGGYLDLTYSVVIYPDLSSAPGHVRSGVGSGFTILSGGSFPKVRLSHKNDKLNYGIKSLRIYRVNISGTAAIEKTGNAFGFMFKGIKNFIGIVFNYPLLILGIALFCCGCAVAVYYRLRS